MSELLYLYTCVPFSYIFSLGLPAPNVSIASPSQPPIIGEPYSLTCSVSVVPGFVGDTTVWWTKQDGTVVNTTAGNRLGLYFNPLSVLNSSLYTCTASLAFSDATTVSAELSNEVLLAGNEWFWLLLAIHIG